MDIDKLTDISQLREDQRELAELIGLEAYKKLVKNYAGSLLYIQKIDSVLRDLRDSEIREKFDGSNYRELAREYDLAEATVRDIVADKKKQLAARPLEGQMTFDA
ncbi:MAG: DNA-binding protein [Ruminococcus sp.]|nr:DNA-binding protein [Ruminococcus sp.]